ncbi:MAG: DoxX family protein [Patescibacteria group bacterium]|nr:DoxX family protein [Patescibacteria group bacterium]MCL5224223.1 DoxX family protein [Patescibacteria group bacterium]
MARTIDIPEPKLSRLLFSDTRFSWLWLILRVYLGWQWLSAGLEKYASSAWVGSQAGSALKPFLAGALSKSAGSHPDVSSWYASFLSHIVIPHAALFSYAVTYGEILVGAGLIIGAFTGIAAFFGAFMNLNYLFAGTVSTNPLLLVMGLLLILAWRNAGWLGIDHWLLPALGVPWQHPKKL